ncbi:acetyl/propionyl/methylcrotonyl-CoA carboxylase subunit alpha [Nocardioides alcanivorans]|uniref:acetyl/propionyl/methylcrotonyl-CoA carboxylase subunit alpha n=1 Tax=Nocardioides alcanivorans TaxID=2897352 RepID=UPI001F22025C|nr:biotin carboxylase N-terminal domain-containing protein [Nocardioides alcanivorans]
MITKILVANRGEIARRVFRTARRLGIATVAVHSDVDADMPFVLDADEAVCLPGNSPAETYLRADLILDAARRSGADAIHPGYGFLSENADFARAVVDAGLVWIGPAPESIEVMGDKLRAKELMHAAGVPQFGQLEPDALTTFDLPVIVKAAAGGGGRGMRVVHDLDQVATSVAAASAEAASAFGDPTVFVETYVENGRHVEVQVMGTADGAVVLGERDCSLQRRHQKVIEEAPAPGLTDDTRKALHEAARKAVEAIDYRGAGTVEFLYDTDADRLYFLEMNTRLQVEHPVTEQVFGVDLVEMQIAVAEGRPVAPVGEPRGHAIEVRLYAEDPAADYAPQTGRLLDFTVPHDAEFFLAAHGIRLDTGFVAGDDVSTFYDAMLAKVIAWAPTREQAARSLAGALERSSLHGLVTNRDQLVASLRHDDFLAGKLSTGFYADHPEVLTGAAADSQVGLVAAVALASHRQRNAVVQSRIPAGFRTVVAQPQVTRFGLAGDEVEVAWYGGREGFRPADADSGVQVLEVSPEAVLLDVGGVRRRYRTRVLADAVLVDGPRGGATLRILPRFVDPADQVAEGSLLAPMPGSIVGVHAAVGDVVTAGQTLVVMEAMKMQHTIVAPYAGVVGELPVAEGEQVEAGAVLALVNAGSEEGE